jgi:signal transduction histidine kinase
LAVAGQLAAGVAHEIRNPLTALKGFVQLMQHGEHAKGKYLDVMASELNRIDLIVSELLVLAKPQANTYKRKDVIEILENVITISETQAVLSNVEIETDYDPNLAPLECDENQLKQVFINFLKNAIESMHDGGRITVSVKRYGSNEVVIRFRDQGCGIPKEILAKLGEPFYTTKEKGTGLGLMVSHKIIEHHRGRIVVTSELNVGTIVDVILPMGSSHS